MFVGRSTQYKCPAVFPEPGETADDIIRGCRKYGAIFREDGPDDECFVVAMRPNIGAELYTEAALRRSF